LVLDQWLPLSSQHCSGLNSITGYHIAQEEDMPLNHAIYESGRDVIFGVSGGYIYKLNATTGAKISSARFYHDRFYDSYVAYSSTTDKLYTTAWMTDTGNEPSATFEQKWLFKINPDTLAVEGTFNITDAGAISSEEYFEAGPREIISVAGDIYFLMFEHSQSAGVVIVKFLVSGETWDNSSGNNKNIGFSEGIVYDPDNDVIWVSTQQGATSHSPGVGLTQFDTVDISGVSNPMPKGLCYRSGDLYFTLYQGTVIERWKIQKVRISDDTNTTIDLGDTDANPRKIRYRSTNDRVYVPTFNANTVVIIDPTTDTVESVKTGFDSPVDVVFTPTKAWAVQHGSQGLKEIV